MSLSARVIKDSLEIISTNQKSWKRDIESSRLYHGQWPDCDSYRAECRAGAEECRKDYNKALHAQSTDELNKIMARYI